MIALVRRDLPIGTVTFLFTDVEGSTKLLNELGPERYSEALAEHRRIIREAFGRRDGVEVDTQGDAFFVAFPTAPVAVQAVEEMLEGLASGPIRVRMGLHTGAPHLTDEGYIGEVVHKGARIAAAGHGGQILLSKETLEHIEAETTDLGEHRLKDFPDPVWIYQLGAERFPPLKTISNTNLPRPASSFVGRERETAEVVMMLRDGARLVTLSGPGGSGKTRLSIEAGTELIADFRNGVFWIDLAPVRDPALVVGTIAQTLGATDDLVGYVGERQMLLLLDNLEQVIEAAPELSPLLSTCPNLRILVTSRELLRVQGEVEYAVPPLTENEAVQLFYLRTGLEPDESVAQLCRRLDNLPLAIELAAGRANVLSPAQILDRLSQRLDVLKGGRDSEARQRTLRSTIAWSYDLLTEEEQRLFTLMAVFRGGWTLEAAEEIAGADLDMLQSLVDKSLVRYAEERFSMLETIREFARERLEASEEGDQIQQRHAEYFLTLAEEAELHLRRHSKEWLDLTELEIDNFRAVLDRLEGAGDTQGVLRLCGAIADLWGVRGTYSELRRRTEAALASDPKRTVARAKALTAASDMAMAEADPGVAKLRAQEALDLNRELGDKWGVGNALMMLGDAAANEGEWEEGRRLFEESERIFREAGDEFDALFASRMLGWMLSELGEHERARALQEDNVRRARAAGNEHMLAQTLEGLASRIIREGRVRDAVPLLEEAYQLNRALDDAFRVAVGVLRFAGALASTGHGETAARVLSCSQALLEEVGIISPWVEQMKGKALDDIRSQLDDDTFDEAWAGGRTMTGDTAVKLALDAWDRPLNGSGGI